MPPYYSQYEHLAPLNIALNQTLPSNSTLHESFSHQQPLLSPFRSIFDLGMDRIAQEHGRNTEDDLAEAGARYSRLPFITANNSSSSNTVIDLTSIPSDETTQDSFISHTRHPHDPNRSRISASNSLNQPTYGSSLNHPPATFTDIYNSIAVDTNVNMPPLPVQPSRMYEPLSAEEYAVRREQQQRHARRLQEVSLHERARQRTEEMLVRRQQQLHRDWRRVQDRNRRRREEELSQEARAQSERAVSGSIQSTSQEESEVAPTSTRTRTQRISRPSTASSEYSISGISDFSDSSISVVSQSNKQTTTMERIDLTAVDDDRDLAQVLAKEQQDAIDSQNNSQNTKNSIASTFSNYKCAICMDSPIDATTTKCGHLFCHKCIVDALKHSKASRIHEAQNHGRRANLSGLCPNCRTPLSDKDIGSNRGLVPIEIKKISRKVYEARKRDKEAAAQVEAIAEEKSRHPKREEVESFIKHEVDFTTDLTSLVKERPHRSKGKRKRHTTEDDIDLELFGENPSTPNPA